MSSKMDALLEPNRKLLNPFFQGYKLVHADSGMVLVSQPLPADIQTEPTLDKYCLGKAQHLASLKADVRWNALKILFTPMGSRYFMMDHGLTIWELDALYPLAVSQLVNRYIHIYAYVYTCTYICIRMHVSARVIERKKQKTRWE